MHSARVGMIGAGQLARMTQRAAIDLAVRLEVLAATEDDPAAAIGTPHLIGPPDDRVLIRELAAGNDAVTLDHELVPNDVLSELIDEGHRVVPDPAALIYAQDKLIASSRLWEAGVPIPRFRAVDDAANVEAFASETGWPVVLKAIRMGYDGRGVVVVDNARDAATVLAEGGPWMAEEMVDLAMELAVLVARRPSGDAITYPLVETIQVDGICHELVMPARVDDETSERAIDLALDLVGAIDAAGIVAVEMFLTTDGRILVNEFAMRPHNSGHATIEGCVTSQFHNHLRAVLDWPLGDTSMRAPAAAMVNILGEGDGDLAMRSLPAALEVAGASIHLYGKAERAGRKIGHVTALGDDADQALDIARRAADRLKGTP